MKSTVFATDIPGHDTVTSMNAESVRDLYLGCIAVVIADAPTDVGVGIERTAIIDL